MYATSSLACVGHRRAESRYGVVLLVCNLCVDVSLGVSAALKSLAMSTFDMSVSHFSSRETVPTSICAANCSDHNLHALMDVRSITCPSRPFAPEPAPDEPQDHP